MLCGEDVDIVALRCVAAKRPATNPGLRCQSPRFYCAFAMGFGSLECFSC
jgi:hypothetical protein